MPSAFRLPGISFEPEPRQPAALLPRMDIAALVGFAASGPLHTPVPIEDLGRFRELFGADPTLAWDGERGKLQPSLLGAAVEAFFRNGGKRCWVVRVADRATPVRRFLLQGLVTAGSEQVDPAAPETASVEARARSAGSWADSVTVDTLLLRERLPFHQFCQFCVDGGNYQLVLRSAPAQLRRGELLEIVLGPEQPVLFLFVDAIEPLPQGVLLSGRDAYWYLPVTGSPTQTVWQYLSPAEGLSYYQDWLGGASPAPAPTIHLLRFEIRTRHGGGERRLTGLAFHHHHARCWTRLPDDAALFRLYQGRQPPALDPEEAALRAEASTPRFPLAGPEAPGPAYLPIAMNTLPDPLRGQGPVALTADEMTNRDGLDQFRAELFFEPHLARVGTRALLAEAEHRYYLQQESLSGLHSLLPLEEITLIGIPDACHRAWNKQLPPLAEGLAAPRLAAVPAEPDEFGRYRLSWSMVPTATAYRLQHDSSPAFIRPTTLVIEPGEPEPGNLDAGAPATAALVALSENCPQARYFRVRALRHGVVSPWSETRGRVLPEQDFKDCQTVPIVELRLEAILAGSPEPFVQLIWITVIDVSSLAFDYELQAATATDFAGAATVYTGTDNAAGVAIPLDAAVYYRVRSRSDSVGPWSNTVLIQPQAHSAYTLVAPADYDVGALLAIQRTLIRFCAARGDLLACLSLPRHYREQQVRDHVAALLPAEEAAAAERSGWVLPLNRDEAGALSHAGLYHPWLASRPETHAGDDRPLAVGYSPPDGAILGRMAQQALTLGAWFAPANQALDGVVALDPVFGLDAWRNLSAAQVNLVWRDPRGFLVFNAETLAQNDELRLINVRRLLILLRRLALREGRGYVFEPSDNDFRSLVRHRFERLLSDLYVRGAFAGASPESAYRVVVDDSVNTRQSLDLGRFIIELRVAPSRPLAFLKIRLIQTGPEQVRVQEA